MSKNLSEFVGPLSRNDYEDAYTRRDKKTIVQLFAEEDAIVAAEVADFADAEKEAIAAASSAWVPVTPQYIDSHFSLWSLSKERGDVYEGVNLPGQVPNSWPGLNDSAVKRLRRDFKPDEYEQEMQEVRQRANSEMKEGIGELSPIHYAIHVQTTPTYHENMVISTMADEYYFIAGYIGWADIHDSGFSQRLRNLVNDPFLVGLRYDLSKVDADILLDPEVDSNFAAMEQNSLPFDLMIGPHQLKHACHLAYRHPKLKLVLNHCGMPVEFTASKQGRSHEISSWRNDIEYLSRYPNVFCKLTATSGKIVELPDSEVTIGANKKAKLSNEDVAGKMYDLVETNAPKETCVTEWKPTSVITHAISCFGPDRCMFGSGWPVCRVISPKQTGWEECGTGGFMVSSGRAMYPLVGRGYTAAVTQLSLWEACRLVEHCLEDVGFGSIEDKRKVFASNAQSVYTLTVRPYGSTRVL